jgi:hypothetical protein
METSKNTPIAHFLELYALRDSLRTQQEQATPATTLIYDGAIENANTQLFELSVLPEVQQYLREIGGEVVRISMELEELNNSGLVEESTIANRIKELEEIRQNPEVKMALEYLTAEELPGVEPFPQRTRRYATEKQIEFAQRLGLSEVSSETSRGLARKLITNEVNKRGRKELSRGWKLYDGVIHPRYGEFEIVAIHEKIVKVTLDPIDGGKKIVISAMNLSECERVQ